MLRLAVASLGSGAAYALLGLCLVLLYRMTGTLNFAQAAIGAMATFATLTLVRAGMPMGPAVGIGICVGAALGASIGLLYAIWYRDKGVIVRSTVSIPLLIGLLAIAFRVFGDSPRTAPSLIGGRTARIAGVNVSYDTLLALVLVVVVAGGLGLLINRTRLGVRLRALAERPITAELLGVRVGWLTVSVWAVAGAISALAVILVAPGRSAAFAPLAFLILPALAAALIGGFERPGVTIAAGFAIAIIEGLGSRWETIAVYRSSLPFFLIALVLLWQQRSEVWDDAR